MADVDDEVARLRADARQAQRDRRDRAEEASDRLALAAAHLLNLAATGDVGAPVAQWDRAWAELEQAHAFHNETVKQRTEDREDHLEPT